MLNVHRLETVNPGSETQLQVGGFKLFNLSSKGIIVHIALGPYSRTGYDIS